MNPRCLVPLTLSALLLLAGRSWAQENHLQITNYTNGKTPPVPVALVGYTGQVKKVLEFDLYVAGCKIVPEDEAQFILRGKSEPQVEGRLFDAINKAPRFGKIYQGGSRRAQAHALSDDVVKAITGQRGIAQTKIAFKVKKNEMTGAGEIYVSDYDGYNAREVTHDNVIVAAPAWVPGHDALVYMSFLFGNPDILYQNLRTGKRHLIAHYTGSNITPTVSPDGRHVAMILSKSGWPDLYISDLEGRHLRQLTHSPVDESCPCWSPNGKTICFATRIHYHRTLATIPAAGGPIHALRVEGVLNPSEPDWSPDGKWIAFTSQMGDFNICIIPAHGGVARVLCTGEDPSWAPNSRTLIYVRRGHGDQRFLSLLDVPTKQHKDLPETIGNCSQPSWAR